MTNRHSSFSSAFITSIITLLLPVGGTAAVMEEVVVTAQKREQNIQDVGIAITAYTGDQLNELGISDPDQLDAMVPGLMVTDFGMTTTTVMTLRGSTQLDFADHQEPPVAVYIDGAYNSYIGGVGQSFYDIDRVEVLKGPQGTLFGRNATGGLVHLITNKPTQETEGYVQVTAGEFHLQRIEGAISGSFSESLSARVSVLIDQDDGYVENIIGGADTPETDSKNLRVQFLYEPSDDFSMHVSARWNDEGGNGATYHAVPAALNFPALSGADLVAGSNGVLGLFGIPDDPNFIIPAVGEGDGLIRRASGQTHIDGCLHPLSAGAYVPGGIDCFGSAVSDDDPLTAEINEVGDFSRESSGITLTFNWQRGDYEFVNIIDYTKVEKYYYEDTDGTPARTFEFYQDVDSWQLSEEFRVHWEGETSRWVAGLYYLHIEGDYESGATLPESLAFSIDNEYSNETDSWAVFAQGEWDLSPDLTLIAGIRYTDDEKDASFEPAGCEFAIFGDPDCSLLLLPLLGFAGTSVQELGYDLNRSEDEISGVLELDYRLNEDVMWYGKITRGNKAGGFNGGAAGIYTPEEVEFDGEVLTSYEVGVKSTLFDNRLRLNGSVFYYDYKDFQTYTQFGPSIKVFNTDSEVTGAELELLANPAEGWEFMLGVSFLDAEVQDLFGDGTLTDVEMTNSPELSLNGMVRYEWPAFGGTMAALVDFNYVDERTLNGIPHPALIADDYLLTNARVSFLSGDDRWLAELWVRNLADEEWVPTVFDLSVFNGLIIEIVGQPRWVGGSITYRW